jgi:hypothetical protein
MIKNKLIYVRFPNESAILTPAHGSNEMMIRGDSDPQSWLKLQKCFPKGINILENQTCLES